MGMADENKIAEPLYWHDVQLTGDPRLPVIGVSWYEAYAYTQWLKKDGELLSKAPG